MTAAIDFPFPPRTVALARMQRAATIGYLVGSAIAAAMRGLSSLTARLAQAHARRRELAQLLEMDDRMLKDIGLTRGEVFAAVDGRSGLRAAAERREAAMDTARKVRTLPRAQAPAINPAAIAVRSSRKAA